MALSDHRVFKMVTDGRRLQGYKTAMGHISNTANVKPRMNVPLSPTHEKLGKALNMPSKEVQLLLEEVFSDPQESDIAAFKQILFLAKLRCHSATAEYADLYRNARDAYEASVERHEQAKIKLASLKEQHDALLQTGEFMSQRQGWIRLIDDMYEIAKTHDFKLDAIPLPEAQFISFIAKSSKHADIVDGVISFKWETIRDNLHHDHVAGILRGWLKKQDEADKKIVEGVAGPILDALLDSLVADGVAIDEF